MKSETLVSKHVLLLSLIYADKAYQSHNLKKILLPTIDTKFKLKLCHSRAICDGFIRSSTGVKVP